MKPQWVLALMFLFVSMAAQAQQGAENGSGGKKAGRADYDLSEIQGCLQRSEGRYILVDKSNTYERLSDTGKLKNFVGHEVRLTGKHSIRTIDTSQAGIASSATEQRYFDVKAITDVSPNCQAYGR